MGECQALELAARRRRTEAQPVRLEALRVCVDMITVLRQMVREGFLTNDGVKHCGPDDPSIPEARYRNASPFATQERQ